jgi:hypothetical protein
MKNENCGRPKRDRGLAIKCYLERMDGKTSVQIGIDNGWRIQSESSRYRCVTAERYIKFGRMSLKESREKVFGIKSEAPIRAKHRKKPIDE